MRKIEVDIMNNWGEDLIWRNYLGLHHAFYNSESITDSKGRWRGTRRRKWEEGRGERKKMEEKRKSLQELRPSFHSATSPIRTALG